MSLISLMKTYLNYSDLFKENQLLLDQQLEQNFKALGSNRNVDQAKELTGGKGHDYFVEKGKEKAKELFGDKDWNKHINYKETDLETNKAYQDFVRWFVKSPTKVSNG